MVDEENHDVASEPTGAAAVNRDRRPDPGVVEGEVVDHAENPAPRRPRRKRIGPQKLLEPKTRPGPKSRRAPRRPHDPRRSPAAPWLSAPLAV